MAAYETIISHAHIKVRDLDRSIAFYTRFFQLHLVERVEDLYAFLTGSHVHHELALQQVGPDAPQASAASVGLYHIAFEVPDSRTFALAYHDLRAAGVEVATVDHLISWAMYFDDPDGNGLEIFWDTRDQPGGAQLWHGINVPLPEAKIMAALDAAPGLDSGGAGTDAPNTAK
jgi:catechol 2,3-dioxygenase